MKHLFTLIIAFSFIQLSIAQSDTTKIKIGDKEIEFILKDGSTLDSLEEEIEKEVETAMEEMEKELENLDNGNNKPNNKIDTDDFAFFNGIEVYTNLLLNDDMNIEGLSDQNITLKADPGRSINVGFSLFGKYIPIAKQHFGLLTGLTFRFTSYNFKEDFSISSAQSGEVTLTEHPERVYEKNRLRAGFLRLPVLLQFATGKEASKSFHTAVGGYAGVRMGKGKYKVEYTENNSSVNSTAKGHYHLNSIDYGAEARIGYGNISVLASYSLAGVFNKDANIDLNGANIGLAVNF